MALKLITAATVLPVSVADAKLSCRFDSVALDADIADMVMDAARLVSHETGQSLTEETWELSLDAFPSAFELTRNPAASVTSLKYTDPAGVEQTLASNLYSLDAKDQYGSAWVVPAYGTEWPATRDEINAVRLRFVAGYPNAAAVPAHLRRQVKINVAILLDDPERLAERLAAIEKVYAL